jgi:hypothetical protein
MATEKNETVTEVLDAENDFVLQFSKPYTFEDEVYTDVDLSGIEDITASDMIAAQKVISKGGTVELLPEMSLQYACVIASRVTKRPIEFFTGLPAKEAMKLKNLVTGFIFGAD